MLKLFNRKKKDNKGFTLVELVIVVAILAILVGLLAPQYTKYVEKSRKSADASNMSELVKVVQVYAGDTANDLPVGTYTITISKDGSKTDISPDVEGKLKAELDKSVPEWEGMKTKSQKWGDGTDAAASDITAAITVGTDGEITVKYSTDRFADYIGGKRISSSTSGGNDGQGGNAGQDGNS